MLVGKIQTNPIQQNRINYSKPAVNPQSKIRYTALPGGIDTINLVNVSFHGINDDLIGAVNGEYASYTRLKAALNSGADVNYSNYTQTCAIIELVGCENDENKFKCLEELLSVGTLDINKRNNYGWTALMRACKMSNTKTVELLLSHPNIDPNLQDQNKDTALIIACRNENKRNSAIIEHLLNHPAIDVNVTNSRGKTALICACYNYYTKAVQLLVHHPEIDMNVVDDQGMTALMYACYNGDLDIVRELLKHPDVDLNIVCNGKTPREIAYKNEYRGILKALNEYKPGVDRRDADIRIGGKIGRPHVDTEKLSPEENIWTKEEISNEFLKLVKSQKYDEAKKMLEITPLIDLEGTDNKLMIQVCCTGKPDFVEKVFDYKFHKQSQMQIEYNARRKEFLENTVQTLSYGELKNNNIALNTIDGFKILMGKREFNPNYIVERASLFERACSIDSEGNLAKQILNKYSDVITVNAAKTRNQTIKNLINEYESVGKYKAVLNNIKDNTTREETRKLAAQQLTELVESENFNPAMTDSNGNTVLHIAAALPEDSARMLIVKSMEKGVDINAENIVGGRPLMSAIMKLAITKDEEGRRSMLSNIRFLLDKGANVDAQDQIGQTALHFACSTTIPILLTMLLSKNPNVFILDKHGNRAAKYLKTQEMKDIYQKYING